MQRRDWESVIGLEVHAQLATDSKLFSGAGTVFGQAANIQACAVDLGLPGVLPIPNRAAILMAVKFGLAIEADISQYSIFARKNYFYPDLPKGYQISQFEQPIITSGQIEIYVGGKVKMIRITRAHLEEDAGKSIHDRADGMTGIDLNRAGMPLLEIVCEPDLRSAKEAVAYMREIHTLVRYLQICDGNMQEGSFRCDANVSVRPVSQSQLGVRAELKNINSFRFVEKAINYEVSRQIDLLQSGGQVVQETRLYDAERDCTRAMRGKEEANDYRYFPDPDLPPIHVSQKTIKELKETLGELPRAKQQRFMREYNLSYEESRILAMDFACANYYEAVLKYRPISAKLAANWICGELFAALTKADISITSSPISPEQLNNLLQRIEDNTLSNKTAKQVFSILWQTQDDVEQIISEQQLEQVTDQQFLIDLVKQVLIEHPKQVQQYQKMNTERKEKMMGFFVGQIMKRSAGKANPKQVNELLRSALSVSGNIN